MISFEKKGDNKLYLKTKFLFHYLWEQREHQHNYKCCSNNNKKMRKGPILCVVSRLQITHKYLCEYFSNKWNVRKSFQEGIMHLKMLLMLLTRSAFYYDKPTHWKHARVRRIIIFIYFLYLLNTTHSRRIMHKKCIQYEIQTNIKST